MIELNFKQYQEKLAEEKKVIFPTEHVFEGTEFILMFFRSREHIDYYVLMDKDKILEYSVIEVFKLNYCYNSLPIKESPIWIEPKYKEDIDYMETRYKSINLMEGEDIVKDSKSYNEFIGKYFNNLEKGVLRHINKIGLEKSITKNFGDFLQELFGFTNTLIFAKHVKKFIKSDLETGRTEAEDELGIKLGFNEAYQLKLNKLANEQLNGYTINGKKWHGIKGVTKEIQQKVIVIVQNGINENKSNAQVSEEIKGVFDSFSEHRSQMIARTETNRVINEGLLLGYKESGLEGGKVFKSIHDNRSSPICDRLSKKYGNKPIPLDDLFIDDETNLSFISPPCHPSCRSRIIFRPL